MTITLQGVLGIVGAVLFVLTALGGAVGVYVRLAVRDELAAFLVKLNGTYVRASLYEQKLAETERRIGALETAGGARG